MSKKDIMTAIDNALESLDGLITGVYDAMLEEDKELWEKAVFHLTEAKALLVKEEDDRKTSGNMIEIFLEER